MRTAVASVWLLSSCLGARADDTAFFESRVRPLLVERCYECHAGTRAEGGLSLDTRAGWEQGGDSGPTVVPDRPEESLLLRAVGYADDNLAMPPSGKLSDAEIETFAEWVRRGAPDPRTVAPAIGGMTEAEAKGWWAFRPLARPPLPDRSGPEPTTGNVIDRFLLSRLEAEGLEPGPPADRRTLVRRATYGLTGLPPVPEEVDAFVADESPDAYERLVDRLLASPHYGERWGRHWLDVARYADTAGENTDRPLPHAWRYRNWVFEAFDRDLPYDEFVRLQIAGDVLRSGETGRDYAEGVTATGYLAVARRFGHDADKDVHLTYENVIDNVGKAFLGLSVACARCHDHKYDPVSAEDYYALYGIFASSRFAFPGCEAKGRPRDLVPLVAAAEIEASRRPWSDRAALREVRLNEIGGRADEIRVRLAAASSRVLAAAAVAEGGTAAFGAGEDRPPLTVDVRRGEVLRLVVSPNGSHGADSTLVEWEIAETDGPRRWGVGDLVSDLIAGNPHPGGGEVASRWYFLDLKDGPELLDERLDAVQGRGELKAWRRGETPSVVANASPEPVSVWTTLPARSFMVHPGPAGPVAVAWVSPVDGRVAVAGRVEDAHPGGGDGVSFRLEQGASAEAGPALEALAATALERAVVLREAAADREPVVPVAFAVTEGRPADARVHLRGDPEKPGETVPRRRLTVFGGDPVPPGPGSGRRELAEWTARSPLSSRVLVNRVWQWHFGRGLVATPNDFGSRGDRPSHPELLERLAARFEEGGRRLKPLHRLIMTSDAYRRSAAATEAQVLRDPENRLLARFSRRRLSAEELRDSLLFVSGELDRTPGRAHPFPAEETWAFTQHAPFVAVYDDARRTAYQMVQRQRRHPFLALFDGADPNASTASRQATTVPTQALFFLNNPFFHARADRLAASFLPLPDDDARLRHAYRVALQRDPTEADRGWAREFLTAYPGDVGEKWAACVRVLLAGNEFLFVD